MSCRQFILLPLFCMLCACSGLGEARHTLAAADSLRVNHGVAYANGVPANNVQRGVGDSLALAEAYTLLGHWRLIYPDDYARACYFMVGFSALVATRWQPCARSSPVPMRRISAA